MPSAYSLSKITWVRDHEPEVFDAAAVVVQAKDFMVFRLAGRIVTDPSDASNAYDQAAGAWSAELLDAAGFGEELFPEIVPSVEVVGAVTPVAAAATGLRAGTPGRARRR